MSKMKYKSNHRGRREKNRREASIVETIKTEMYPSFWKDFFLPKVLSVLSVVNVLRVNL